MANFIDMLVEPDAPTTDQDVEMVSLAFELECESEHEMGDPQAYLRVFLHSRNGGRPCPEWALAEIEKRASEELNDPRGINKRIRKKKDIIKQAALSAAREHAHDNEEALDDFDIAIRAQNLLVTCDEYTGNKKKGPKPVGALDKWSQGRRKTQPPYHQYWNDKFYCMLDEVF